eukprot:SM000055S18297  [mRNA]  locus=s55:696196:703035:+ [translate_table: standard]
MTQEVLDELLSERGSPNVLPTGLCLVRDQVRVVADLPASYVQVDDDGSGIGRDDLELVGERHATSKLHTLEQLDEGPTTLGFRGEALSSIAEFALLEITTRARGSPLTFCKIFKGGKTLSLGIAIHDRDYGTTVTVRDLFFNQPVRRRLFRVRPGKELQSIKERVVRHALIRPAVSFTVISDRASLQPMLHVEKGTPVLDILNAVHGKDFIAGWQKLDYAREHLRLTGHLTVKAGRVAGKVLPTAPLDWAPVLLFVQDILDDLCKNAAAAQPANAVEEAQHVADAHENLLLDVCNPTSVKKRLAPYEGHCMHEIALRTSGTSFTAGTQRQLEIERGQPTARQLLVRTWRTLNTCAASEEVLDQVPLRSPTAAARNVRKAVSSSAALEGALGALPGSVIGDAVLVGESSDPLQDVEEKAVVEGLSLGGGLKVPSDVPSPEVVGNTLKKSIASMLLGWVNPCMRTEHEEVLTLEGPLLKGSSEGLVPKAVSKDAFQRSRVLQQVGEKFIAAATGKVLLLIDQHAADERVQLEEMRKQHVSVTEEQMLDSYRERVEHWGWQYTGTEASQRKNRMSPAGCQVNLTAAPSVLGVTFLAADLLEYLNQLAETQGSSTPPVPILRLLSSKACRGAIMFGDKLTRGECHLLNDHLKQTQLLFQCAHGRPTMVPLVDLSALRMALRQPPVMRQADADPAKVRTQSRYESLNNLNNRAGRQLRWLRPCHSRAACNTLLDNGEQAPGDRLRLLQTGTSFPSSTSS